MSTTTRDTITEEIMAIFWALDANRQGQLAEFAQTLMDEQRAAED